MPKIAAMSDILKQTAKIVRKSTDSVDRAGANVWTDPIQPVELELVSTVKLERILKSNDEDTKRKIRDVVDDDPDANGVLAHDAESDSYELVDADGKEEFSLVSTQMLKRMLGKDVPETANDDVDKVVTGFDPYNSD